MFALRQVLCGDIVVALACASIGVSVAFAGALTFSPPVNLALLLLGLGLVTYALLSVWQTDLKRQRSTHPTVIPSDEHILSLVDGLSDETKAKIAGPFKKIVQEELGIS